MASLPQRTWIPSGMDVVRDGLWGRLGVPREFGGTVVSGSLNGLAIHQDPESGDALVFVGASNGGVFVRRYHFGKDRWDPGWRWLSAPGSGYTGGQSIGQLAISRDGHYLAVGQGNPSNYAAVGAPGEGLQIGRIRANGEVHWLPTNHRARPILQRQQIRSLVWPQGGLIASSWTAPSYGEPGSGALLQATTGRRGISAAQSSALQATSAQLAYLPIQAGTIGLSLNGDPLTGAEVELQIDRSATPLGSWQGLKGQNYADVLNQWRHQGLVPARLALHPELVGGKLIAFVGSQVNGRIERIDRLTIHPGNGRLLHRSSLQLQGSNAGGSAQAATNFFYGNFSFAADPHSPDGRGVYFGGNQYSNSQLSSALTYGGGLLYAHFDRKSSQRARIREVLYGPRINHPMVAEKAELVQPFSPGQPHADSRSIGFLNTREGPRLIQTDDGGIWQLPLQRRRPGAAAGWWTSLVAPGLNSLELNMADWGSRSNLIASSYQDNAASVGYLGESHAINLWAGDGQIAIIDDGRPQNSRRRQQDGDYSIYLSSQQYLGYGVISRLVIDRQGWIKARDEIDFYLRRQGEVLPWGSSPEGRSYRSDPAATPFRLPIAANPHREGALAMAGQFNLYESVERDSNVLPNSLIFERLLQSDAAYAFSSLDYQGRSGHQRWGSLYATGTLAGEAGSQPSFIAGRAATNRHSEKQLTLFTADGTSAGASGVIQDIAHDPLSRRRHRLYWLEGGSNLATLERSPRNSQQVLRLGAVDYRGQTPELQPLQQLTLRELGLPRVRGDAWGYQNLVLVPATEAHEAFLVIGGLGGTWISRLDAESGRPLGFEPMNYRGLPAGRGPGSYVTSLTYDPEDDLLIAGTLGQGSWLYDFDGEIGERPKPQQLLHASASSREQQLRGQADLTRRGTQRNSGLVIQLDSRLQNQRQPTDLVLTLHKAQQWRRFMELVSPYNIDLDVATSLNPLAEARTTAKRFLNILDPQGLTFRGGEERNGDIHLPLRFNPGVHLQVISLNAREFNRYRSTVSLRYTVATADGEERVRRAFNLTPPLGSHTGSDDPLIGRQRRGNRQQRWQPEPAVPASDRFMEALDAGWSAILPIAADANGLAHQLHDPLGMEENGATSNALAKQSHWPSALFNGLAA